jgi:hypothetical protein
METPDLSNEFHPVPKPSKREKKPKKAPGAGKRTNAWQKGLHDLKQAFAEHKVMDCEIRFEGCLKNNFLGFAHVKRRVNYDEQELVDPNNVVLACQQCHYTVDYEMPRGESEKLLAGLVKKRKW